MGGEALNITVDTNLLVRTLVSDDAAQARLAEHVLKNADRIALPLTMLCETAWVLRGVYGFSADLIGRAMEQVLSIKNAQVNRAAVEAGLTLLRSGGDFADGVIAHEGRALGGDVFVTFDKKAVRLMHERGLAAKLLH